MTERWRKRLRDLDLVGPSEDVFARAKSGPSMPEEAIPRPGVGSRVVTGVAAFLVFGLAISVFAIPALRLRGGAGGSGTSMLLPLWPVRTLDDLEDLQARLDEGDESAAYAGDPSETAAEFGRQVLGWTDMQVVESASSGGGVSWRLGMPPATSFSSLDPAAGWTVGPSTPSVEAPSSFRTFHLSPQSSCPPTARCPQLPPVMVTVYQPLRGDGVWAVLSADSDNLSLSTSPGGHITEGTLITADLTYQASMPANMGLHIGAGDCSVDLAAGSWASEGTTHGEAGLKVALPPLQETKCNQVEPGYVFVAMFEDGANSAQDPFAGSSPVVALDAVPVIVEWPEEGPAVSDVAEPSETPGSTPSPVELAWTTYTDPLGWTIDVPDPWIWERFDEAGRVSYRGAHFASGDVTFVGGDSPITRVIPDSGEVMLFVWSEEGGPFIPPSDDTSLPLSYDDLEASSDGWRMSFWANGRPFSILVKPGEGDEGVSLEHEVILRRMIESIRFDSWQIGEERGGWTAIAMRGEVTWDRLGEGPDAGVYVLFDTDAGPRLFGPTVTCDFDGGPVEGQNMTHDAQGNAVIECPDGTMIVWDSDGRPVPTSATQPPLAEHPVIVAWDGTLIAQLGTTI